MKSLLLAAASRAKGPFSVPLSESFGGGEGADDAEAAVLHVDRGNGRKAERFEHVVRIDIRRELVPRCTVA